MAQDSKKPVGRGELVVSVGLVVGALLACGGATAEQLTTRAAFDLNCPAAQITVIRLDGATRGVTGCGQRVTYVESCDAPVNNAYRSCIWVLNSARQPIDTAQTPPSPSSPAPSSPAPSSPAPSSPAPSSQAPW